MVNNNNNCTPNGIMLVGIATLLGTSLRHAYLRSGGTTGALVFERMVEDGRGVACAVRPFTSEAHRRAAVDSGGIRTRVISPVWCPVDNDDDEVNQEPHQKEEQEENKNEEDIVPQHHPCCFFLPVNYTSIIAVDVFGYGGGFDDDRASMVSSASLAVDVLLINATLHSIIYPRSRLSGYEVSIRVFANTLEYILDDSKPLSIVSRTLKMKKENHVAGIVADVIPRTVIMRGCTPWYVDEFPKNFLFSYAHSSKTVLSTIHLPPLHATTNSDDVDENNSNNTNNNNTTNNSYNTTHDQLLPSHFLRNCANLRTLDIEPLKYICIIGGGFLQGCSGLEELDLSPFANNLKDCGDSFLLRCSGLSTLNLAPLRHITQIQGSFLEGCTGLTSLDLSPLCNVESISSRFLFGCSGLISPAPPLPTTSTTTTDNINTSSSTNTSSPPTPPSTTTSSPTTLDLSSLSKAVSIGESLLGCCTSLQYIDLSPIVCTTSMKRLLEGCSSLEHVVLPRFENRHPIPTVIPSSYLINCKALKSVDFTKTAGIQHVKKINEEFLSGCSGLESIDLTPLSNVTSVGSDFMSRCGMLSHIDITPLTNTNDALRVVPPRFLARTGLTTLDLSPLRTITSVIGEDFLGGCTSLTTIDLSPLQHSVVEVHKGFLGGCTLLLPPIGELSIALPNAEIH